MEDGVRDIEKIIAVIKAVSPAAIAAERRLAKELGSLFGTGIKRTMAELRKRGIPGSVVDRVAMTHRIIPPVEEVTEKIVEASRLQVKRAVARASTAMGLKITEPSEHVAQRIREHIFTATEGTMEQIRGDIMEALEDAYRQGLGIDDAAKYMQDYFDSLQDYRLRLIARTEIQGAQNAAAHETMVDLGVEYKQWWTGQDERVRGNDPRDTANHVELHGQITRLEDRFSNGLRFPGDRSGPIEEWINCRCTTNPFIIPEGFTAPPGKQWFYEEDLQEL